MRSGLALQDRRDPDPTSDASDLPWWLVVGTLTLVGGVLPVLVTLHFGALSLPRGDGAAFLTSAYRFAEHGVIDGGHWASMNLVGQLFGAAPVVVVFGRDVAALNVEIAVIGVVGLYAVYDLAHGLLSSRRALFVALLVAIWPVWMALSATFYTDVPAFAFAMVSLALGARWAAASTRHHGLLVASVVVGFVGFSVREHSIVAPIAVLVVGLWTRRSPHERRVLVATLVALIVTCAALLAWRSSLSGFAPQPVHVPTVYAGERVADEAVHIAILLGLAVAPALLLVGPRAIVERAWARAPRCTVVACLSAAALMVADLVRVGLSFFAPEMLAANQWTVNSFERLLDPMLITPLLLVGMAGALLLLCALVPVACDGASAIRGRYLPTTESAARATIALAVAGYTGAYLLLAALLAGAYSRYLLPIVPLVAILVLSSRPAFEPTRRSMRTAAIALAVVLGALSVATTASNASFDAATWTLASREARRLGAADLVDGGFSWNAYHAGQAIGGWLATVPDACVVVKATRTPPAAGVPANRVWTVRTHVWIVAVRPHSQADNACG